MNPDEPRDDEQSHLILPGGLEVDAEEKVETERSKDRSREDEQYIPVIVKRTDAVRRHPDDSLQHAIEEGKEQLDRPSASLALSSLAAGLIVGFSAMAVAVVTIATDPLESAVLTRIATAFVYPLGFVICVMSGAQLFTEHTATAVYPVLDGQASFASLFRLWAIIIVGNIIGAAASAGLLTLTEPVLQAHSGFVIIGHHLVDHETFILLTSAILAGWLMALGAWLVASTGPDFSQMVSIYIVTFLIGLGGFHHSIAGSVEMFAAMLASDEFTPQQGVRFISLALLGNLIGGSVFVAVLNYGHIRKTQATGKDS
ncbi:MAG: formate/nitrite transporter family protein [Planctomycetaceae bacterium]